MVYIERDNNPPWDFESADDADQHSVVAGLLKTHSVKKPGLKAMQVVIWRWKLTIASS
jgi:hypothetical protein